MLTLRNPEGPDVPEPGLERRHGRGAVAGRLRPARGGLPAVDRAGAGGQADGPDRRLRHGRLIRRRGGPAAFVAGLNGFLEAVAPTRARVAGLADRPRAEGRTLPVPLAHNATPERYADSIAEVARSRSAWFMTSSSRFASGRSGRRRSPTTASTSTRPGTPSSPAGSSGAWSRPRAGVPADRAGRRQRRRVGTGSDVRAAEPSATGVGSGRSARRWPWWATSLL